MGFFSNLHHSTRQRWRDAGLAHLDASHALGLLLLLAVLLSQYPLWFGKGGWFKVWDLEKQVSVARAESAKLRSRNDGLGEEVRDLKTGFDALEERARVELGMLKSNETYYRVIERRAAMQSNAIPGVGVQ
jgi:cell division protein FtsB